MTDHDERNEARKRVQYVGPSARGGDEDPSDGEVGAGERLRVWQRTDRFFARWVAISKRLVIFAACLVAVSLVGDSMGVDGEVARLVRLICAAIVALCGFATVQLDQWRQERAALLLPGGIFCVGEGERWLVSLVRLNGDECAMSPTAPWARFTDGQWGQICDTHEEVVDSWREAYGLKFRCAFLFLGLGEGLAGGIGLASLCSMPSVLVIALDVLTLTSLIVAGGIARKESRARLAVLDAIAGDLLLDALEDDAMPRDGLPDVEDADRQEG